MQAVYDDAEWLYAFQSSACFGDNSHSAPAPYPKAQLLQRMFFPSLAPSVDAVTQARFEYWRAAQKVAQQRTADCNAALATVDTVAQAVAKTLPNKELVESVTVAYGAYLKARQTFIEEASKCGRALV